MASEVAPLLRKYGSLEQAITGGLERMDSPTTVFVSHKLLANSVCDKAFFLTVLSRVLGKIWEAWRQSSGLGGSGWWIKNVLVHK